MNRISRRASALLLFILILAGGLGFFLYEYATQSGQWVIAPGSPHVYNSNNIGCGQVVDRNGVLLLDMTSARTYAEDAAVRCATLHWLGDRNGNISAPAIAEYAREMTGFDPVNGLYSYDGSAGEAVLTISASVQKAALEAMAGRKGTVGVYNYKTGEILCAVSTPTYDPDQVPDIAADTTGTYTGVYLNRFTQSSYVPGSIFKVVTTAAALDCVPDILEQRFTCTGEYDYGEYDVTCERAHGTLDLKGAMANSCNCCFAQISQLVGKENLKKYVEQFRITEPMTFDGVKTAKGNFNLDGAAPVQVAWASIGQHTDLINPARYLQFMGMIAGGGQAAVPHIVAKVAVGEQTNYEAKIVPSERIMPEELAQTLQGYMRNNVELVYGTGNFPGLTVCGKSGTSQLGGDQVSNAMFAGFVTDEAYPLAFIAVVENGGYGSATCVPILSHVLAACKLELDAA